MKGTKTHVALSEAACESLSTRLMATPTMDARGSVRAQSMVLAGAGGTAFSEEPCPSATSIGHSGHVTS